MPKPTFANLAPAKRQAIIDLAIAEFAEHPYHLASISRIVERAGIAKGSLYQYFEHKQDLFLFLLEYATQAQLALLKELALPDSQLDFFALLRWQMSTSTRVGLATPQLTQLMYRATTDDLPFREEVIRRLQSAGEGHLRELVIHGIARGELDPALDVTLAAFLIRGLLGELRRLIAERVGKTMGEAAYDVAALASRDIEQIYDQVISMLQYGLSAMGRPAEDRGGAH